ncbi:glycosyltransferase family 2 protein [Fangia hongkongensis]|uniref:glycosyltransferase family 2 protein n=1 Tax=Fangia hongkongensis TaxID=270495 RepID=UPI000379CB89|nr:glycosyltransferase [Fangia hongkongensis]MBK2124528.1 glycosyltransferase [Fangia hongkongensis]
MKISGFTFLRNAEELCFPYIQSIKSIIDICDEFIIALGQSQDDTKEKLLSLAQEYPQIKIIYTIWNEHMQVKGYTYAQQKMIAQFACTGDWLFYLEGDEMVHEKDLANIKKAMIQYKDDPEVEALAFHYYHFYGNTNTYLSSPTWYRYAPRVIKASVRSYAPDGLYWLVLDPKKSNRIARYPKAKLLDCYMYHYGWVRPESAMSKKISQVNKHWGKKEGFDQSYRDIDERILTEFTGVHPKLIDGFFPNEKGVFKANPVHKLTKKEKRQRFKMKLEKAFGVDLSRRHFTKVR